MEKALQLAQTLSTRICHDLASSIGTIDNCLSLLEVQNKTIAQKAKILLEEETNNLVRKIKFLRDCYNVSGGENMMSAIYLHKSLKDFFTSNSGQLTVNFSDGIIFLDSIFAKASACLINLALEHISSEDKIDVLFGKSKGNNFLRILAKSKRLNPKEASFLVLTSVQPQDIPIDIHNCREHYFNMLCEKAGYKLIAKKTRKSLEYKLVKRI
jgi:hypothetical protein